MYKMKTVAPEGSEPQYMYFAFDEEKAKPRKDVPEKSPSITLCALRHNDDVVVGVAVRSELDAFNKERGRTIALGRAVAVIKGEKQHKINGSMFVPRLHPDLMSLHPKLVSELERVSLGFRQMVFDDIERSKKIAVEKLANQ